MCRGQHSCKKEEEEGELVCNAGLHPSHAGCPGAISGEVALQLRQALAKEQGLAYSGNSV